MKIILSRKGFDSAAGGAPSPIFPDGRMVSLPIPDRQSPLRYKDIRRQETNLGTLVAELTGGRIPAHFYAHLDPDLQPDSLDRLPEWRPLFGQSGAAQGHLRKNGVGVGDIFLFFGLFRPVVRRGSQWCWDIRFPAIHALWGWLQIGEVLNVPGCDPVKYGWAGYHPHFHRAAERNNTVYIARRYLSLPKTTARLPGAGTFGRFSQKLQFSAQDAPSHCIWELPRWFYPGAGKCPLTYHSDLTRWQETPSSTRLKAVSRGQEFILDVQEYPEAVGWVLSLMSEALTVQTRNGHRIEHASHSKKGLPYLQTAPPQPSGNCGTR